MASAHNGFGLPPGGDLKNKNYIGGPRLKKSLPKHCH
jgi:hypothetical protein